MYSTEEIRAFLDGNDIAAAVLAATERIAFDINDDTAWYLRGKAQWRLGNHAAAISDFEHALTLNPAGEARHALEMSRDILDFFNPDLLNP